MIKLPKINRLNFILGVAALFFIGYILKIGLIIPLFLLSLFVYLKFSDISPRTFSLLNLIFLFVLFFVYSYLVIRRAWPVFYIPFCAIPMLATILFGSLQISLLLSLASSVSLSLAAGGNLYLGVLSLVSAILSSVLVFGVRRRMVVIRSGLIIGLIQAACLFLMRHFWFNTPNQYLFFLLNGVASGIIVVGLLPVFEYLFRTVTNVSLLELADFNQPLLQRMVAEAPGTYHHSLIVGNLSEVACRAVGANALLARIGAYYHDIGKLDKANYFSENQGAAGGNRHETLSAAMSKMIIMNHVKEGVELAKRHRLNPLLVDFILKHHGSSLVYYFYRRALENLEEDEQVKEEGFRYPGPKPDTRETAIVLLADSVEAATRALKEPVPKRIEEVVHKVINNKFIDGQLDECDLTLKDLEKISAVFIRILGGIYHSRVNYPEATDSEDNRKKSPKEDSPSPRQDKEISP